MISILNGNSEVDAWWPLATIVIDFPISFLFTNGGIGELFGIALLAGVWHFYWPQWLVMLYLRIKDRI